MTFRRKNPGSLSRLLIGMTSAAALAAVVLVLAMAHSQERSTALQLQERDGRLFASALAHAILSAVTSDEQHSGHVDSLLTHLAHDPAVRNIAVLAPDGTVRAHAGADPVVLPAPDLLARALATRTETVITDLPARLMRFLVPIPARDHLQQQGLLYVSIDISRSLAAVGHRMWFSAGAVVATVIALTLLLYFLIRRTVVRPVIHLAGQAQRLGAGELSVRSGLDAAGAGSQELHQLAAAFDSMAERMQRSEEEMEERARERTHELEIAVAELESFSYAVSHDLRSPLRSIDGFSLILAERLAPHLTDETRGYIERVRQQAQYMGSLIDNLLTLAHVSRTDLDRQRVDLSALAAECVGNLRRADPQRSVEVQVQPAMQADADPELLRVALANLLDNAWKFTRDAAAPRIEVGVERRHGCVVAFVRDNGVGFDPAYVERLFTPFRRLHSPREFGGTGIGLAIVQRVIQRHGGQIWAQNVPGGGATFFFTLAGPG